jgi:EmrB/QacA subfamily drug resistance transporter
VPLYGKLGDIHGRRPMFLIAISIFLVGSALCGLAQDMPQLVVFRAVQGLGAGGLVPLALATIGNIVPPRDRGRYQGLFGGAFAAASIIGPLVGGFIVDNWSWRWIFYVNLPVGGAAMVVIWLTMPRRTEKRGHSVDWVGAGVLAFGSTALLLGLVWGGGQYAWTSPQVVGALATAAASLAVFAAVERRAAEPILPFDLMWSSSTVRASVLCMGLVGMAMFGTITYVPLFVQGVIGTSATSSGVVLTPLMLGAVTTSFLAGQWVSRSGRYKPNALVGPPILALGLVLLWRMDVNTTNAEAARNMAITGVGLGLMMQVFVLSVQNSVPSRHIGSATALTQFSRSIGATLGVTIMGVIVNQGLPPSVRGHEQVIHRLAPHARVALANALQPAFLAAAAVCVVVFLLVFFGIEEVPLRKGFEEPTLVAELGEGGGGDPAPVPRR